ncbi:MAG TPA: S8 family peptidase [Bacteroidales bacterium]|nr:S8 family peptidase [Bacteroidales bacterium]
MRKILVFALTLLVVGVISCQKEEMVPNVSEVQDEVIVKNGDIIPGKFIVVFKSEAYKATISLPFEESQLKAQQYATTFLKDYGIPAKQIDQVYGAAISGFSAELTELQVNALLKDKRVAYVEPDRWIVLDYKVEQTSDAAKGQTIPWGITRIGGAVNYTGTNVAWIIDTGIDLDHPDLNVNVTKSKNFVSTAKSPDDDNGHGSHVAGTVAAKNNDIGVIGVAAGAPVVAVKVLNRRGSGAYSTIISGVNYVASAGVAGDVANMSLGGPTYQALDDAVLAASNKGIKFCLAAGNESTDANNSSPARVNGTNIYTISAMDNADKFASFSNYGNPPIDYCAPGVSIYSTYKNGKYATLSGTSMASPHACGVVLLGAPKTDGYVLNDPDGKPDPIIHR